MIETFRNEAAILIEDENDIESFVVDRTSGVIKMILWLVFSVLSNSYQIENKNVLEDSNDHFWLIFEKYFENDICISFINSLKIFKTCNQKAFLWILLEFSQKSIDSIFLKIMKTSQIKEYYVLKKNAILTYFIRDTIEIFSELKKINYTLKVEVCENYENYLKDHKNLENTTFMLLGTIDYKNEGKLLLDKNTNRNAIKKNSFDSPSKSSFYFTNRKFSHQLKRKNVGFLSSLIEKRNTIDSLAIFSAKNSFKHSFNFSKNQFTPFLNLSMQKQSQILFDFRNTVHALNALNYELMKGINETKSKIKEISQQRNNNEKQDESTALINNDKDKMGKIENEQEVNWKKESPKSLKKINSFFFTPQTIKVKHSNSQKTVRAQISIEKNLADLCKNFDELSKHVNNEKIESCPVFLRLKKKKNSEILFQEMHLRLNNNDLKYLKKPERVMKVLKFKIY